MWGKMMSVGLGVKPLNPVGDLMVGRNGCSVIEGLQGPPDQLRGQLAFAF